MYLVLAVFSVAAFGLNVWMAFSSPRIALVITNDTLELRRRVRPLALSRTDVVAVRGDVAGRPSWSTEVRVETRDRTVRLPALDVKPVELISRLQEWAEVDETHTPRMNARLNRLSNRSCRGAAGPAFARDALR